MEIENEKGISNIEDYIKYIKTTKELYKIITADYIETFDDINNKTLHKFFTNCNNNNNY